LVMDGFYTSALNSKMTISVVFSDGTKVSEVETIEDDGYFDGACTLKLNSPPELALTLDLKQVIVNTGAKEVVYTISAQKSKEFKKNLYNIVNAK
jgi:pyruvate/2-oxoglutarate dehydrogenase complex dihydrolipoamide dehydrogenase (E3) component